MLVLLLSQSLVWDIRPSGNENIASYDIKSRLESCGFSVGDLWHKKSLSEVENEFLKLYDDVSWININRRGTVAYVSVIEKEKEKLAEFQSHLEKLQRNIELLKNMQ